MTTGAKLRYTWVTILVFALPFLARAEFYPVEANLKRLGLPSSLAKASVRFQPLTTKGDINNDCSAVVVSDNGHVFTAAHCLDACLRKAGVYQAESANVERLKPELLPAECPVLINEKYTIIKVLATADCIDAGVTKARPDPSCVGLDIALGQIAPELAPVCAVIAPSIGPQYAFALSYPHEKTLRLRDGEVEEFVQYFSEGQLVPFARTCNRIANSPKNPEDEKPGLRSLGSPETIDMYEREVAQGKQFQMTIDIIKGSSGAPIFDREGRVLGVAQGYSLKRHDRYLECAGATFMAPLIQLDLAIRFPGVDLDASTNCTLRRAR